MSRKTKITLGVVAGLIVLGVCAVQCSKGNGCPPMRLISQRKA